MANIFGINQYKRLIFGSSRFIGRHVVEAFYEADHVVSCADLILADDPID